MNAPINLKTWWLLLHQIGHPPLLFAESLWWGHRHCAESLWWRVWRPHREHLKTGMCFSTKLCHEINATFVKLGNHSEKKHLESSSRPILPAIFGIDFKLGQHCTHTPELTDSTGEPEDCGPPTQTQKHYFHHQTLMFAHYWGSRVAAFLINMNKSNFFLPSYQGFCTILCGNLVFLPYILLVYCI